MRTVSCSGRQYEKIFYGYALVFLTLSFNDIDLLPDFFGYLLIAEGLKNLAAMLTGLFAAVPASILSVAALSANVIFLFRLSHIRETLEKQKDPPAKQSLQGGSYSLSPMLST